MTAAEYNEKYGGKTKNKPVKQSQGSQAGKDKPITEVSTSSLKSTLAGYSPVKQDVLNQIEELHSQADNELNHLSHTESLPVFAFMKKCRYALEIVKLLKL